MDKLSNIEINTNLDMLILLVGLEFPSKRQSLSFDQAGRNVGKPLHSTTVVTESS